MKKKFLFFAVMLLGAFLVGCSSEDDYSSYELDDDAKLEYTKNLILSYGQKYGLTNIHFDDNLLRKNLGLPKEVYENDVIFMAVKMGKIESISKAKRKTRRSYGIGENEPGGNSPQDPVLYVEGSKEVSHTIYNYKVKFSIHYLFMNRGANCVDVINNHVDVLKLYYCLDKSCKKQHEMEWGSGGTCTSTNTSPSLSGPVTFQRGAMAHFTVPYNVHISFTYLDTRLNEDLAGSFNISQEVQEQNNGNNN
jgi:hypothetical protein